MYSIKEYWLFIVKIIYILISLDGVYGLEIQDTTFSCLRKIYK